MDSIDVHRRPTPWGGAGEAAATLEDLDDVATLYREEAARIRRIVSAHVSASPAVIEDACQVAWCRLLVHRARLRPDSARAWLVQVAVHETLRAVRRERRMRSLESLTEREGRREDAPPLRLVSSAPDLMEDLVQQRARLASISALPDRQRRLMWLQGLGLSYREMAGQTGMTRRTVERQLMRARSSLAKAGA
jgi:RNA polymerase sigma factor (sigma-70 family)